MEGVYKKKTYMYKDIDFDYWVIKINGKFWFMGPIAYALGYENPTDAILSIIPPKERKHVEEVKAEMPFGLKLESSISEDILISENGFYRLLSRSPTQGVISFQKWLFANILKNTKQHKKWRININIYRYG
jgi:prophage antirepressor-like protein